MTTFDGDDDLRDYSEEAYNRDFCDHCGTTHDDGKHSEEYDEFGNVVIYP